MDTGVSPTHAGHPAAIEPPRPGHQLQPVPPEAEGLEEEISGLRKRLRRMLGDDTTDLVLVVRAMDTLVRAVLAQHRLSPRSNKDLFARYAAMLAGFKDQLAPPPGSDSAE